MQADETGWREDGKNGYIWSVSTPEVRYYEYHHSRGSEVVKQWLRESFEGVLGSDFYASYNIYQGLHQRMPGCICCAMAMSSKSSIPMIKRCSSGPRMSKPSMSGPSPTPVLMPACLQPSKRRNARKQQHAFEQELWQLCAPYAHTSSPLHTLCERIECFLPELFVFVALPGVPAHNNLAERSVRPLVIARKISGGSRSPKGSDTRMDLFSLFGTWAAQDLNPFFQCLAELSQESSLL